MASIDDVTESFAASLALASNEIIDLSRRSGGAQRRPRQSFLLAKPLAKPPPVMNDLRRFFRRVWVLDKNFQIQEREDHHFVLSFDLLRDRNKVLRGGPWRINHAPIVLQAYDGVAPIQSVDMRSLFFWVKISNIPPAFEDPDTIADIASVAGKFLEMDTKLFNNMRKVRVRVAHDLAKPFLLKKKLRLAPGVEPEISFFFENLVGMCNSCNFLRHEGEKCPVSMESSRPKHTPVERLKIGSPSFSFSAGNFRFHGVQTPVLPPVSRALFQNHTSSRKPVILREKLLPTIPADNSLALVPVSDLQGTNQSPTKEAHAAASTEISEFLQSPSKQGTSPSNALVMVSETLQSDKPFDEDDMVSQDTKVNGNSKQQEHGNAPTNVEIRMEKRERPPTSGASPKKLKILLPDLFQKVEIQDAPGKKMKIPSFPCKFTARSLGLTEAPGSILIPKAPIVEVPKPTKKRGRPLGSKNKNPSKAKMVAAAQVTCYEYLTKPPSPSLKGKEKI